MIESTAAGAPVILCATQRLARRLQLDAMAQTAGSIRALPQTLTLGQWLDATIEAALLTGEVRLDQAPTRVLSEFQERLLREGGLKSATRGIDEADEAPSVEFPSAQRAAGAAPAMGKDLAPRTRAALEEVLDELVQLRLGLTPDKDA